MSNLLLAMLQQAGVPVDRFGDSTEPLPGLLDLIGAIPATSNTHREGVSPCGFVTGIGHFWRLPSADRWPRPVRPSPDRLLILPNP